MKKKNQPLNMLNFQQDKETEPSLAHCFSCFHHFLHCGYFLIMIIIIIYKYIRCLFFFFGCWRFSVLLDLYCLVKCSYNHSLMWARPPSPLPPSLPPSLHLPPLPSLSFALRRRNHPIIVHPSSFSSVPPTTLARETAASRWFGF